MKEKKLDIIEQPVPDPKGDEANKQEEPEVKAAVKMHYTSAPGDPIGVVRRGHFFDIKNPLLSPTAIVQPGDLVQMPEKLFKQHFFENLIDPRDLPPRFICRHDFRRLGADGDFLYVPAKAILEFEDLDREEAFRLWRTGVIRPMTEEDEE